MGHKVIHSVRVRVCMCVCSAQASVPVILSPEGFNLVPQALCSKAVTDNWQGVCEICMIRCTVSASVRVCARECVADCMYLLYNCVCSAWMVLSAT